MIHVSFSLVSQSIFFILLLFERQSIEQQYQYVYSMLTSITFCFKNPKRTPFALFSAYNQIKLENCYSNEFTSHITSDNNSRYTIIYPNGSAHIELYSMIRKNISRTIRYHTWNSVRATELEWRIPKVRWKCFHSINIENEVMSYDILANACAVGINLHDIVFFFSTFETEDKHFLTFRTNY